MASAWPRSFNVRIAQLFVGETKILCNQICYLRRTPRPPKFLEGINQWTKEAKIALQK